MLNFQSRLIVAAVLAFCTATFAQERPVIRVGVAPLRGGADNVSAAAQTRLIRSLNQNKGLKGFNCSIQAFPLKASQAGQAIAEAKENSYHLILLSRLTDLLRSEKVVLSGSPGSSDYVTSITAKLAYQVLRVVDGVQSGAGIAGGEGENSDRDALMQAVDDLAKRVISNIRQKGEGIVEGGVAHNPAQHDIQNAFETQFIGADYCKWLPTNIAHAEALRRVCEYAMSLPAKLPNFICEQQTSRYRGDNRVPRDLITALVRYEDGNESFSEVKLNGKPAPDAATTTPGLWSTGEFGSNVRSIFDLSNHPLFDFSGQNTVNGIAVWVFSYRILNQNDALWRLHSEDQMLAPPYSGELWVAQKTGDLLRFRAVAQDIPSSFPTQSAELVTDYDGVGFGDGSVFLLPTTSTVATRSRGEGLTRNVLEFRNCHRFRAKAQMLLEIPGSTREASGANAPSGGESALREVEREEQIYAILREQALRDDSALLDAEQHEQLNVITVASLLRLAHLEKERQKNAAILAAKAATPDRGAPKLEAAFKITVKLVPVTVVLRDPQGNAVGTLRKEDFQLFDNGAPQTIKRFSIETSRVRDGLPSATSGSEKAQTVAVDPSTATPSDRYIAYLFDDIHISFEDLVAAREAAIQRLDALRPQDRLAVLTTSGQVAMDFTSDRGMLAEALTELRPHPINRGVLCPQISPYIADLIVNQDDRDALGMATKDAASCAFGGMAASGPELARAEQIARSTSLEVLSASSAESQSILGVLRRAIREMANAPGSRSIVLISPGFLMLTPETRESIAALIDRALESQIVVDTLDVRGLTTPIPAANQSHSSNAVVRFRYDREEEASQSEVLADLAYSTGGVFFHNNNDLNEGFRRTTEAPEYIYVLGFSPQKLDGKYHKLKVRLNTQAELTIQAREGYYAVKPATTR